MTCGVIYVDTMAVAASLLTVLAMHEHMSRGLFMLIIDKDM